VCRRFADLTPTMPTVNLHGDAHLEQYAVTSLSRGLTDFDDSSRGPPVLDWLRFGVSIYLAARHLGWSSQSREFFTVFLDGYRAALDDPDLVAPEPELARDLRARFVADRSKFLEWASTVIEPVSPDERARIESALQPSFRRMVETDANGARDMGFFDIVMMGKLELGIGSALDEKYLVRVEGPTVDSEDDVILELKEIRNLEGIPCIDGSARLDPLRVLVGQARIAYVPYDYIGYLQYGDRTFWVHSWVMNYRQLDVRNDGREPADLAEVVFDVGVQLGHGHPNQIASPMDEELRAVLERLVDELEPRLVREVESLYTDVLDAWVRFRALAPPVPEDARESQPPPYPGADDL